MPKSNKTNKRVPNTNSKTKNNRLSKSTIEELNVPRAVAGWATQGPAGGLGLLLQSSRDNLRRKVEVVPQKLDAVIGEVPVVMHPSEGLAHVLLRLEALHQLYHLQVRHIDLRMLRQVIVLLRIAHSLCKNPQKKIFRLKSKGKSNA